MKELKWHRSRSLSLLPGYLRILGTGGLTWSKNLPVTPVFNTYLPYAIVNDEGRQANKIRDCSQLLSDAAAYIATYESEQNVYYLKVYGNGVSDALDIEKRQSDDTKANHIPDGCENITVPGDLDADSGVDRLDLKFIAVSRKKAVKENVPRDLDGNGKMNGFDIREWIL